MSIAAQVGKHGLWAAKGRLGIDHPFGFAERGELGGEGVQVLTSDSFDVIVTRHLVWTLVDPAAAFAEWKRVLGPGGQLLLIDGDFVSRGWVARTLARLSPRRSQNMNSRHQEILSQVHFAQGARAEQVAFLLAEAGFTDIRIDTDLSKIHRAQARQLGWRRSLIRHSEHRYAISAKV